MSSTAGQTQTVNTSTEGAQTAVAVGALAGGGYAVAWAVDGRAISVQRYDAAGVRLGPETPVAFDLQQHPDSAVAVLGDGSVVVAYTSTATVPGSPYPTEVASVLTQRFDPSGAAAGGVVEAGALSHPTIARDYRLPAQPAFLTWSDGSYAVTWDVLQIRGAYGSGVSGAVATFDSRGEPLPGGPRLFGSGEAGTGASFATMPDGGLLFAEHYVAGGQYLVRFTPAGDQSRTATVAAAADGSALPGHSILLALRHGGYALWSTAGEAPYLQLLDASGAAAGARQPIGHAPYRAEALADGGFVLLWRVEGQDPAEPDLVAQRFDAAGAATTGAVRIEANGGEPLVTALVDGGWALAWTAAGADGSLDVFTQSYGDAQVAAQAPAAPDAGATLDAAGWSPGATMHGLPGDDVLHGTAGHDTVDGGAGIDTAVIAAPLGSVTRCTVADGGVTLTTSQGTDTLVGVERVRLADALFALDTHAPGGGAAGGHAWQAAALYRAAFGQLPDQAALSRWTAQADQAGGMGALAQQMVDAYAPGATTADVVAHVYAVLVGGRPDQATVQSLASLFASGGEALAAAATLPLNTGLMVGFTGSVQQLDPGWF